MKIGRSIKVVAFEDKETGEGIIRTDRMHSEHGLHITMGLSDIHFLSKEEKGLSLAENLRKKQAENEEK